MTINVCEKDCVREHDRSLIGHVQKEFIAERRCKADRSFPICYHARTRKQVIVCTKR